MSSAYDKLLRAERPIHHQDDFAAKHPPMPREKRAKLFAPFDALTGFGEALDEQEIVWQEREAPSEEKQQELEERLQFLWNRYCEYRSGVRDTGDGSAEKPFQPPSVTVRYFAESPEQAGRGQYRTVSGLVLKLDLTQRYMLLLPDCEASPVRIPLSEIADYDGRVFVRWKDSLP